jgi:LmbE family N-acetylglucosaminyl deacetylase
VQVAKHTLVAVFAHPDDEAFGSGGTLARYAARGHDVYVVTATRGEAGEISEPGLANPANLPEVREQELRCACRTYGVHPPIFMDYVDGQLTVVHQGQAVARLVRIIRDVEPDVLITFGPDGIYGHYDHIAVHRWVTIAFDLAADPECFPNLLRDACRPHQVSKLYCRAMNEAQLAGMAKDGRPAVMMDGVPFPFVARKDSEITTVVDVGDFLDVKLAGIRCHATQISPQNPVVEAPAQVMEEDWFRTESYVLTRSTVGWPERVETDLLERL